MSNRAAPPLHTIARKGLRPSSVLVFGSNKLGIHGAGSAFIASKYFNAQYGIGEGRTGRCYALPTKRTPYEYMSVEDLRESVDRFLAHAVAHPKDSFVLVEIGCKLAGFTVAQVAPMFAKAVAMPNVFLPWSFLKHLTDTEGLE